MFYQNLLAMRNTADVTGGKPIAVLLQSISGVSAINPLVAFYDIHGGKREVLFFYFVPDTTRDCIYPLSRIHIQALTSLISAYFGLESRECKCLEYLSIIYIYTEKTQLNASRENSIINILIKAKTPPVRVQAFLTGGLYPRPTFTF
jgi:hypothetical protein